MVHYSTTNQSFIKMSVILEDLGIKNNTFMLNLIDEDLLDIDPFSKDLTLIQKAKIINEIVNNPWYYYREIVRIPTSGGLTRFELHRGNLALIWSVINNISSFVVWPRQTYKTTTCCVIYSYLIYYGSIHNRVVFLAHEDAAVKKNLLDLKNIRDNLPEWLNLYDPKKDRDNEKELHYKSGDNKITCRAPARSEDTARKAGRGLTTPIQYFDEAAFIPYIYEMFDSIAFAYSTASKAAKENGAPYHQIMSTTAGFLHTLEGKWAFKFLNGCADFTELFYDMDIDVVKNIIENGSTSGFLNLSFMYYDLSKGDDYLEEQKKRVVNSLNPKDTLDREVLNKWKDINTDHPLGQERIEKLNNLIKSPKDFIIINDTYALRLYIDVNDFKWTKPLIGGLDLSGNLKGDFSVLTIIDPEDFSVVAVLRTNSQSTILFAYAIVTIMTKLCPGLVLFPERNFNSAVIDTIVSKIPNAFRRVYHENNDENRPGLFNSKRIRPILFNNILKIAVDEHGHKIYDRNIINEISGLIRTRNGRIDHKPGEHDDTLISYLLGLYFLLYVDNIGLYIDKSIILSKTNSNLVPIKKENNNNKLSTKMRRIMNDSYTDLMNTNNVNSIDDIASLMLKSSVNNSDINSSLYSYNDEDTDIVNKIEENDSLIEVKSNIDRIKDKQSNIKELHVLDHENVNNNINDFKSVFGSTFHNKEQTFDSIFN